MKTYELFRYHYDNMLQFYSVSLLTMQNTWLIKMCVKGLGTNVNSSVQCKHNILSNCGKSTDASK